MFSNLQLPCSAWYFFFYEFGPTGGLCRSSAQRPRRRILATHSGIRGYVLYTYRPTDQQILSSYWSAFLLYQTHKYFWPSFMGLGYCKCVHSTEVCTIIRTSELPFRALVSICRPLLCSLKEIWISESKLITLWREWDMANPRQPQGQSWNSQVTEIADSELWQFIAQMAPGMVPQP